MQRSGLITGLHQLSKVITFINHWLIWFSQ